jgi:hypothetical protein
LDGYAKRLEDRDRQNESIAALKHDLKAIGIAKSPDPITPDIEKAISNVRATLKGAKGVSSKFGWTFVACSIEAFLHQNLAAAAGTPTTPPLGIRPRHRLIQYQVETPRVRQRQPHLQLLRRLV